ncbi:MAG: 2-C-methyl-D-erythritol 4-phosphate cytidylyltransferase [Clostridiales bacterium]|nr:2-C-methyl-D-erythritol 4-phosphate cytidylyltransferase [Clostridiales bacterium]
MERFEVIIPAAGSGSRMGGDTPKLLLEIGGMPIIRRTVKVFTDNFPECRITVVAGGESEEDIRDALSDLPVRFAPGGDTRANSVYNGLKSLEGLEDISSDTKVLIHDGARCLVTKDIICRVLEALDRFDAAVCGVAEKNTLKKVARRGSDIIVESTPCRSNYVEVQTPQGFKYHAMVSCFKPELISHEITDDVMFAELADIDVAVVDGSYSNIKITTPEDISSAEGMLKV